LFKEVPSKLIVSPVFQQLVTTSGAYSLCYIINRILTSMYAKIILTYNLSQRTNK